MMLRKIPAAAFALCLVSLRPALAEDPDVVANSAAAQAASGVSHWRLVATDEDAFGLVDVGVLGGGRSGPQLKLAMVLRKPRYGVAFAVGLEEFQCAKHTETMVELVMYDERGVVVKRMPGEDGPRDIPDGSNVDKAFAIACHKGDQSEGAPEFEDLVEARAALLKGETSTD